MEIQSLQRVYQTIIWKTDSPLANWSAFEHCQGSLDINFLPSSCYVAGL